MKQLFLIFFVIFLLVAGGVVLYASRVPDIYQSTAVVGIDGANAMSDEQINSARDRLRDSAFLERMIESLQMYGYGKNPNFVMERAITIAQRQIVAGKASGSTFSASFTAADPQIARHVTRYLTEELIRSGEGYHVVKEADLPTKALYPTRLQLVLMGVGGGFVLGLGAAILVGAIKASLRPARPA